MINMKSTIEDLQKDNLEVQNKYEEEVKQRTGNPRLMINLLSKLTIYSIANSNPDINTSYRFCRIANNFN